MIDTKQKILDAAERLIGEQGYAATSLRRIIGDAGVNLASVHYHFGSKEELLHELIVRKAGPVNERRLAMLTRFEELSEPQSPPIEQVLEAFLLPAFELRSSSPEFVRVMGRLHGEGMMPTVVRSYFQDVITRYRAAFRRAAPHLSEADLGWRIHFMIGSMAHAMWGGPELWQAVTGANESDTPVLVRRMVVFLAAGFRARAIEIESQEVY